MTLPPVLVQREMRAGLVSGVSLRRPEERLHPASCHEPSDEEPADPKQNRGGRRVGPGVPAWLDGTFDTDATKGILDTSSRLRISHGCS
jgi:hypothetical protein